MRYHGDSWIPTCAKAFVDQKELWQDLVPQNESDSTQLVQEFFSCVAALMSNQLRGMVINSLQDFLDFFMIHKVRRSFVSSANSFNLCHYLGQGIMWPKGHLRSQESTPSTAQFLGPWAFFLSMNDMFALDYCFHR